MKKTNNTIIVNFILDKSGSMESCEEGTIAGFNKYLKDLKKKDGNVLFSLTLFDSMVNRRYTLTPLKEIERLTTENYQPDGSTALYDAVVDTTEDVADQADKMRESKPAVLTVIMTDGEENASTKHDRACLNELTQKLEKEGNWSFIFLGANQDSWANARELGFSVGNVANFAATNRGMMASMNAVYSASANLMDTVQAGKGLSSVNLLANLKSGGTDDLA